MNSAPIDFLRPPPAPQLGWLLLLVACASAGATWTCRQQVAEQQRHTHAAIQQQHEHASRERALATRPAVPTVQDRRLQRMHQHLHQPWLATLRSVENATEGPVLLLLLAIDPSTGRVQLEAEAPGFADALAYAKRLGEPGALTSVRLLGHEPLNDVVTGGVKQRFTLAGQWAQR